MGRKRLHLTMSAEAITIIRIAAAIAGQTVSTYVEHTVLPVARAAMEAAQGHARPIWTRTHEEDDDGTGQEKT